MKLTESRLRTLIEEELNKILDEAPPQRDYKVTEEPIFVRIAGKRYFWPRIKKFLEANPSVDRDMLEKLARMGLLKQYASESIEATEFRAAKRQDAVKKGIPVGVRGGGPDEPTGPKYKGGAGFPTLPKGTINEQAAYDPANTGCPEIAQKYYKAKGIMFINRYEANNGVGYTATGMKGFENMTGTAIPRPGDDDCAGMQRALVQLIANIKKGAK